MQVPDFNYDQAFDRNLGWLTPEEQAKLRRSCVAIAGVGGAGGFQAQALARLGIGSFKIADPDHFELTNFNRQIGASCGTLGQSKTEVTRDMILSINPTAKIEMFPKGIDAGNIDAFLEGVDLVLDGIDFYALEAKLLLFKASREKGIAAITSCPLGFGASLMVFQSGGMSFEDYLDLRPEMTPEDRQFALAFGLSPTPLCLRYMNNRASDLSSGRAASVVPGLMLVGALAASEAVKCLTGKGKVLSAPHVYQTDLLTQKTVRKYYPGGMKHPLMKLKKGIILKFFLPRKKAASETASPEAAEPRENALRP
ncbi:MAG TPA: ThiF family adenylyltransferase [Verrucomicrobiae bacterium]|nr:ThiF family adenylyltransferase [Verrucomicrobiae bacterium]